MHSGVVLMQSFLPNEKETRQLHDILPPELNVYLSRFLLPVETTPRGIIASVERCLKNIRYSESIIEGQRSTVE